MKCNKYTITEDLSIFDERTDEVDGTTKVDYIRETITGIKDILNDYKDLTSLCAPQIGVPLRLFVVKTAGSVSGESKYKTYINPIIIQKKGHHMSCETNPTLPNKYFIIPRDDEIVMTYQDVDGTVEYADFKGVFAEVVEQMVDMLDGITLADYGLDLDDVGGLEKFNKASKKDKAELIGMYLEQLGQYSKDLNEEMKSNDKMKYLNDVVKFMTGIINGDIVPVDPVKVEKDKDELVV